MHDDTMEYRLYTEAELEEHWKAYDDSDDDSDTDGSDVDDSEDAGGGDLTRAESPG